MAMRVVPAVISTGKLDVVAWGWGNLHLLPCRPSMSSYKSSSALHLQSSLEVHRSVVRCSGRQSRECPPPIVRRTTYSSARLMWDHNNSNRMGWGQAMGTPAAAGAKEILLHFAALHRHYAVPRSLAP
ncbi:hypothetical protein MPTK1_8g06990 [Marchantia polymorpha subsp. ruderalis]|uniref:Uncharacterized protein n=1 Tax=Marchantia polymorpha TaxID=3197 RepID=A0A2R6XID2_MARPO|nr:hypothetical protein MARPO_0013s0093 [Marchantia polymorpha]BBN18979.1 hypothetical protein Mp_8g06990 [Marchantia polymorpha subsp. ruderalis]|eukprot:PTQ45867.1 hypothetical protein MARPO_0013s0093 [Marchantia polymorpha]